MNARTLLETDIALLLSEYEYYAKFLLMCNRIFDDPKVPSLGVSVKDGRINLYVNSKFYCNLERKHRLGILLHEVEHLVRLHVNVAKDAPGLNEEITAKNGKKFKLNFMSLNIAMDRELNPSLKNKRRDSFTAVIDDVVTTLDGNEFKPVTAKNFSENYGDCLDEGDYAYYYEKIKHKVKTDAANGTLDDLLDSMERMDHMDDHAIWEESDNSSITKEVIRGAANKAAQQTSGQIPSHLRKHIQKLNSSLVNWQNELDSFIQNVTNTTYKSTRLRRNRRYGVLQPGYKVEREYNLAFIVDTSGSQWGPVLDQVWPELNSLHANNVNISVIECDAEVGKIWSFSDEKDNEVEWTGGGGTRFQPALDAAASLDVDGIIYYTDGMNMDNDLTLPQIPTLWLLSPEPQIKDFMERIVELPSLELIKYPKQKKD